MLKGYHKKGSRPDSHLPITLPILHKLLDSACNLAIYTSSVGSPPPIQTGQLFKLADGSDNTIALKLVFVNYKHSYNQRPFSIVKHRQPPFCPVQLLLDCLALRGNQPGPLFASLDTTSASRSFFTDIVRLALTSCGLNPSRYKGHSFRIKAPSFAADGGMSDVQIWPRLFKRWIVPSTG